MLSMASAPTWMTIESGRKHAAPCAINASTACLCCIMSMVTSAGQQAVECPMLFACQPGAEQEQKAGESEKGLGLQKRNVRIRFVLLA